MSPKQFKSARPDPNLILYTKLTLICYFHGVYMHNYIIDDRSHRVDGKKVKIKYLTGNYFWPNFF